MKVLKTVGKPANRAAGAPNPKDPFIIYFLTSDVLVWPVIGAGGVVLEGDFIMKPGATMKKLYLTSSKISSTGEAEGDEDAVGIMKKLEGSHPGTSIEIREFVAAALGEDFVLLFGDCRTEGLTQIGTKCSPMKIKPSYSDNNEGSMFNIAFEQYVRTEFPPFHYTGNVVLEAPAEAADLGLDILEASGYQYQLPVSDDADPANVIDIASIDLPHGDMVSLIGSGGAEPAVLSTGAATAATVLLKDGTDWTALKDATITFKVFKDDATTYLVEVKRS